MRPLRVVKDIQQVRLKKLHEAYRNVVRVLADAVRAAPVPAGSDVALDYAYTRRLLEM